MITVDEGPKSKLLLIALAAIVALAVAGGVYGFLHTGVKPPPPPARPEAEKTRFLCSKCSAEFLLTPDQLPPGYLDRAPVGPEAAIDCPKCGNAACAYPPRQCPNCKKYYLAPADLAPPSSAPKDPEARRCPHCGTDPYEWQLKHVKPKI